LTDYRLIDYRVTGAIARVELNRPEKRNAINRQMIEELGSALERAASEKDAHAVLITGAGQDFCAGMDVAELAASADADLPEHLKSAGALANLYRALRRHPLPVIAAVKGRALGGGAGLATACDIVLAAESAQFGYPEVKIGFVPAIVMSILRRSVGEKRAFELLVSGEPVLARRALRMGMITQVFPDDDFGPYVEEYVSVLVEKSASAVSLTKKLLYSIDAMSFDEAIEAGVRMNAEARMTEDARSGFQRFRKRKS
jgi:methylglutaconyl-CoA hydratase